MKERSDEELMKLYIGEGNNESFSEIYKRYYKTLYKYFVWNTGNPELSADLTQNVMLKLYTDPQLFDPSKEFRVWIFTVAKNHWKNAIRNRAVARKQIQLAGERDQALSSENVNPGEELEKLNHIQKNIGQLSEIHREIMVLKYSNNLTIKEIGQILQCSEGTVKSRLFNAIKKLKDLIQKEK